MLYTQTGTPYYASPEVWKDQPYDLKSDIWSLGCVCYEMCSLVPPFRAENMDGLYKRVLKGQYSRIPKIYSDELSHVIKKLLNVNAQQRPTSEQILTSELVQRKLRSFGLLDLIPEKLLKVEPQIEHLKHKKKYQSLESHREFDANIEGGGHYNPKLLSTI